MNRLFRIAYGVWRIVCRIEGKADSKLNAIRNTRYAIRSFTLVELLIVTVIIAIISLAVFSTFSSGLKIYNRMNSEFTLEDAVIFCDRMGQDLRNSLDFAGINFTGKDNEFGFASVFYSARMSKRTVGRVKYIFDSSAEKIERHAEDYSFIYNQEEPAGRQALAKIKSCVFAYYFFDSKEKEFIWLSEWKKEGLPLAVRMEFEIEERPELKFIRTFSVPIGQARNETEDE